MFLTEDSKRVPSRWYVRSLMLNLGAEALRPKVPNQSPVESVESAVDLSLSDHKCCRFFQKDHKCHNPTLKQVPNMKPFTGSWTFLVLVAFGAAFLGDAFRLSIPSAFEVARLANPGESKYPKQRQHLGPKSI